jgi:thiol-disulfide isomerase/thioredoxin
VTRSPRILATVLACLLLASCTGGSAGSSSGGGGSASQPGAAVQVDVDTPQLRRLKAQAEVRPCRPGRAATDLPELTLPCLGGGPSVRLDSLRGPLVVNLFAQWCGPCRSEMPYYEELHQKARGTLDVVGVDYLDTRPDKALELVRDTGVTYPLLADPGGLLRADLRIRGLPGVAFVSADGSVQVEFGVVDSYAELRAATEKHLAVKLPA